jgi:hypothetical protein
LIGTGLGFEPPPHGKSVALSIGTDQFGFIIFRHLGGNELGSQPRFVRVEGMLIGNGAAKSDELVPPQEGVPL